MSKQAAREPREMCHSSIALDKELVIGLRNYCDSILPRRTFNFAVAEAIHQFLENRKGDK